MNKNNISKAVSATKSVQSTAVSGTPKMGISSYQSTSSAIKSKSNTVTSSSYSWSNSKQITSSSSNATRLVAEKVDASKTTSLSNSSQSVAATKYVYLNNVNSESPMTGKKYESVYQKTPSNSSYKSTPIAPPTPAIHFEPNPPKMLPILSNAAISNPGTASSFSRDANPFSTEFQSNHARRVIPSAELYKVACLQSKKWTDDHHKPIPTGNTINKMNGLLGTGGLSSMSATRNNGNQAAIKPSGTGSSTTDKRLSTLNGSSQSINAPNYIGKPGEFSKGGYLIIFNNEKFKNKEQNRVGSSFDVDAIRRTFYDFGFRKAVVKHNLKRAEIDQEVRALAKFDFKKYCCIVVVILSHGNQNESLDAWDTSYNLSRDFIDILIRNPTLLGKPKIFIISACKGSKLLMEGRVRIETDSSPYSNDMIPFTRDILKLYSTYEGFASIRIPTQGTIFIQTFCTILEKYGKTKPVEDIFKLVIQDLSARKGHQQVPLSSSSMADVFCLGDIRQ